MAQIKKAEDVRPGDEIRWTHPGRQKWFVVRSSRWVDGFHVLTIKTKDGDVQVRMDPEYRIDAR